MIMFHDVCCSFKVASSNECWKFNLFIFKWWDLGESGLPWKYVHLSSKTEVNRCYLPQALCISLKWSFTKVTNAAAAPKSLQSCPTLCDPIDSSPPSSPVPGILQARTLEWLPFPSPMLESEKWKWSRSVVSDS